MSAIYNPQGQQDVITELQSILSSVQAIDANTDGLEGSLTSLIAEVQTLNSVDFATETTLANIDSTMTSILAAVADLDANTDEIEAKLDTVNSNLTTLLAVDFATSAKQDSIIAELSKGASATPISVAQSASSVQLAAADPNRKELIIRNEAQGNQDLYLGLGVAATTNDAIKIPKGAVFVLDSYTGVVNGIWSAAGSGNARIQDISA